MVGVVVFAFLLGLSLGVLLGRRAARPAGPDGSPLAAPAPKPAGVVAPPRAAPNKRARKAGLTEESFTPSDDILDKLRLAAEGELDPSVLADEPPARPQPAADEARPPAAVDPRLAEAEQRILDRLRRQAGGDAGYSDTDDTDDADDAGSDRS